MKKRYCIGLFVALVLLACLSAGSRISYERLMERKEMEHAQKVEKQWIQTRANAKKQDGYWLTELNGYLAVYRYDRKTLYEVTDIRLEELPVSVQKEIRQGKKLSTAKELYGFLENYSS